MPRSLTLADIGSPGICWVVEEAQKAGVDIDVIADWSLARVVHMNGQLPDHLRSSVLLKFPEMEYYRDGGGPHNSPNEGFNHDTFGVCFPL